MRFQVIDGKACLVIVYCGTCGAQQQWRVSAGGKHQIVAGDCMCPPLLSDMERAVRAACDWSESKKEMIDK